MNGFIDITERNKDDYNKLVTHPLQSYEWGEFRKKTGVTVIRKGLFKKDKLIDGFTLTIHKIPRTPWNIGYLPKSKLPDEELSKELEKIGKEHNCIFIQLEPNIKEVENLKFKIEKLIENCKLKIVNSFHPLFTKYTFILDLTKSDENLLKAMHPKTRYNIKVAQKHGVEVKEDNSDKSFETYLKLTLETTKRQRFFAHTEQYHRLMWQTLKSQKLDNSLGAHLLVAKYKDQTLVTWIVFVFHDTLYYPYGASSSEHREVMASNLMMWEAIRFGKKLGLKKFDMWGSLGPNPDPNDPWIGFHRFKQGYGANLIEFVGSYDLVINPILYEGYKVADKLRWLMLSFFKKQTITPTNPDSHQVCTR